MNDLPRMLTVRQVADTLAASERYVRGLIRDGKLKAMRFKQRGTWRIYADSVSRLIDHPSHHERSDAYYERRAEAAMARLGYSPHPEHARLAPGRRSAR